MADLGKAKEIELNMNIPTQNVVVVVVVSFDEERPEKKKQRMTTIRSIL